MNELIKITTSENGKKLVSARELHEFLEVTERFQQWFDKRVAKYGFVENEDFIGCKIYHTLAKQELQDYAITTDMAKELSMLQNTEKGKLARQYFIKCEKQLVEIQDKANLLLAIYSGGQEGILASKKLTEIEVKEATTPLLEKIEIDKPLVEFAEHVSQSSNSIDMGQFAKLVKDEDIKIGRNRLFDWMRENKYLMKSNEPYQRYIEQGLFEVIENTYTTPYGIKTNTKTLVTGKGQLYFVEKLRKLQLN